MARVSTLMRKIFRKDSGGSSSDSDGADDRRGIHLRLRKAVTMGKARQVAELLDDGASPVWMESEDDRHRFHRRRGSGEPQLNALLLACRRGNVEVLTMLLDAFFEEPQVLEHFSRAMYCLVIRHDHWQAFQRLQQRRVPITAMTSESLDSPTSVTSPRLLSAAAVENSSSKLPLPIFVAAEHGRHHILSFLLNHQPRDWAGYTFDGHSLLSIATKNGHYECVKVLLDCQAATGRALDASISIARRHRQAHVLVLLTSYLPEYACDPEPLYKSYNPPPSSHANDTVETTNQGMQWNIPAGTRARGRGSIAETVTSEFDDDSRRSLMINSPINYDNAEEMSRVEEMRVRAEMEHEQRQSGMMWLLDGREPIEDMQRRVDPFGVSNDGFAVLRSAHDNAPKSESSYSSYSAEEEVWYAVKSSEKSQQHADLLLGFEDDESPLESSVIVHEEEVTDELPPLSVEKPALTPAPRSLPFARSARSRKLISVRSRGFQQHYQQLAAIQENPSGEIEA